ncbi:MAG: hypothetical protein CL946_12030 [Ectothiorhodospiraceae bacterium]|nr:hypothetical protein [Ectothiorhodospiraceae bacterium]
MMMNNRVTTALIIIGITFAASAFSQGFDHSTFDGLLKRYVDRDGMVNYPGFAKSESFKEYVAAIGKADTKKFSDNEMLAFYINAYNALVIKNVIDHMPLDSPMDVDGFFKKKKFSIAGEKMTLDKLEYDHIIPLGGALIHFGVVCAAQSCPKLIRKAYTPGTVYRQLEENARTFLRDPSKNKLDKAANTLKLSEIFKWFSDDFEKKFGSVRAVAEKYMSDSDAAYIKKNKPSIDYLRYDWSLNSQ